MTTPTTPTRQGPRLIGLTGLAGSGKDTVRNILQEQHGFNGLAFADPIRDMLQVLLHHCGASVQYMATRELKEQPIPELGFSYRHLAQALGTEWGRSLSPTFWIRVAEASINATRSATFDDCAWVISDVRFAEEADWVRAQGGVIWRVLRPGTALVRQHISEAGAHTIDYDACVLNSRTIDDLYREVNTLLKGRP